MGDGRVCKLTGKTLHAYNMRCVDIQLGPNGEPPVGWFKKAEAQLDKNFVDYFEQLMEALPKKPFSETLFAIGLGHIASDVAWARLEPKKSLQLFKRLIAATDNSMNEVAFNPGHADAILRIAKAMTETGLVEEAMPIFERVFTFTAYMNGTSESLITSAAIYLGEEASVGRKAAPVFQKMLAATESLIINKWVQMDTFILLGYWAGKLKLKEIAETSFRKAEAIASFLDPKREKQVLWQNIDNARLLP